MGATTQAQPQKTESTTFTARPVDGSSVRVEFYTLPQGVAAPSWRDESSGKDSGDALPGPHLRALVAVISDAGQDTVTERVDLAVTSFARPLTEAPCADPGKTDLQAAMKAVHAAAAAIVGFTP